MYTFLLLVLREKLLNQTQGDTNLLQVYARRQGAGYLKVAEVDHAVHHLCDTEAVAEVVKWVVPVVVMNTEL